MANACEAITAPTPKEASVAFHMVERCEAFVFTVKSQIGLFGNNWNPGFQTPTRAFDVPRAVLGLDPERDGWVPR